MTLTRSAPAVGILALVAMAIAPAQAEGPKIKKNVQNASYAQAKVERPGARGKTYLGRAPYICGPSGFGQRSRCFLRASTQ